MSLDFEAIPYSEYWKYVVEAEISKLTYVED